MPPLPEAFKSPLNVDVPVPADWVIVLAVIVCAVTFLAAVIVNAFNAVLPPALNSKVISLDPEFNVKLPGPSTVFCKAMISLFVVKEAEVGIVIAPVKSIVPVPVVAVEPPRETPPDPFWMMEPAIERLAPEVSVSVPLLVTMRLPPIAVVTLFWKVKPLPAKEMPEPPVALTAP